MCASVPARTIPAGNWGHEVDAVPSLPHHADVTAARQLGESTREVDILIIGGGVTGMLLLDRLHQQGYQVCLIERNALGHGQTIQAQGIIHGGLKYALGGRANAASRAIRDMPNRWRAMFDGTGDTDLSAVAIRSDNCYLWSTRSASSLLGLLGARLALRSRPKRVSAEDYPPALQGVTGPVLTMHEPVLDPQSMLQCLADRHHDRLALDEVIALEQKDAGVTVTTQSGLTWRAARVVLAAGQGNGPLRSMAGLDATAQQIRPLRMVMVRGVSTPLHGHCVRGGKPWLTITSAEATDGELVWQIGGDLAEQGVKMTPQDTIELAAKSLRTALPSCPVDALQWATYEAHRAEQSDEDGYRPDLPGLREDGCILTAWPTKLALAPLLVDELLEKLSSPPVPRPSHTSSPVADQATPPVAQPPWEEIDSWSTAPSAGPA